MAVEKTGLSSPGARLGTQSCSDGTKHLLAASLGTASGRLCQRPWLLVDHLLRVEKSQLHHEVKLCRSFAFPLSKPGLSFV